MGTIERELKCALKMLDLRYNDIARELRIPVSTLSNFLNGITEMPQEIRKKLEKMIGEQYAKSETLTVRR